MPDARRSVLIGGDNLLTLLARHKAEAEADLRSHTETQAADGAKVDAFMSDQTTAELGAKEARKRAAGELGIDAIREARILTAEMGFRRARKYASDWSIHASFHQMGMEGESFKLVCVRDVLDEVRLQMPWYRRIFA